MSSETPNTPESPLVEYLKERDEACPSCGYNLRGLRSEHCPECHEALVLRIGLAEPKQGTFIAGLVALAAGTGFSGLLALYFVYYVVRRSRLSGAEKYLSITLVGFVIEGTLMIVWLKNRGRIGRCSPSMRTILVGAAIGLTLANLVTFGLNVR